MQEMTGYSSRKPMNNDSWAATFDCIVNVTLGQCCQTIRLPRRVVMQYNSAQVDTTLLSLVHTDDYSH